MFRIIKSNLCLINKYWSNLSFQIKAVYDELFKNFYTFIKCKSNVQKFKFFLLDKFFHSIFPSNLLICCQALGTSYWLDILGMNYLLNVLSMNSLLNTLDINYIYFLMYYINDLLNVLDINYFLHILGANYLLNVLSRIICWM